MCRKPILLLTLSLMMGLPLAHAASTVDPNLVGWWKFDEGSGTTAEDSSGFDNHGTVTDAEWVAGFVDGALNINAAGYVDVPAEAWSTIDRQLTVAFWAYGDPASQPQNHFTFGAFQDAAVGASRVASCHVPWGNGQVYFDTGGTAPDSGYDRINKAATAEEYEGRWQHWAFTKNVDTGEQKIYLNAVLWHSGGGMTRTMGGAGVTVFTIGSGPSYTQNYAGMIDDFRLYDRVLTEAELRILAARPKAYDPDPPDGAEGVTLALLSWTAGTSAAFHDVYLGTTPDLGPTNLVTRNPKAVTVHYHQPGLEPGTTYYWRIDEVEVDGVTIYEGDVWSFTAAPLKAWNPIPPDGAAFQDPDVDLSWTAGATAFTHDLYFGTDETAVADGTGNTFKANQPETTYEPGTLALETTYYWRIDEVEQGGTKHTGDVWSFTTIPIIPIADPNLVAWWTLDEGEGTTAIDWSGHNNDGTLRGNPQWMVDGYDGGALNFNGSNDYVAIQNLNYNNTSLAGVTVCAWIRTTDSGDQVIASYDRNEYWRLEINGNGGGPGQVGWDVMTSTGQVDYGSNRRVDDGDWHHLAGVFDSGRLTIYIDGTAEASTTGGSTYGTGNARYGYLGVGSESSGFDGNKGPTNYFDGDMDDVRIYDKILTQAEIKQVMRGDPLLAWHPSPVNRSTPDIDRATPLSWQPGDEAAQHDAYLGTDETAVKNADTSDTTGIYRGRQAATSYTPTEALQWGQTYYWRIDEVNNDATISKGRVWTFTVADYLIVDDFERYDDYCDRIFYAWKDGWGYSADPDCGVAASTGNGTGSTVGNLSFPYAEQSIVHGGTQSMPFEYNNTGTGGKARYSEASLEFASPRDWTKGDVKALTLWFYGDPANEAEQLYVAVEDNAGHVKVVNHPEPPRIQIGRWQEWNIELEEFSGTGVNLAAVKKMYIGLGNRSNPQAGGSGKLYIDDIRIYPPRCVPSMGQPVADLSGNCVVDYADVEIISDQWLDSGFVITPANPGTANLVAHWKFDGDAQDSSGNAHHGFVNGTTEWVAGVSGNALRFDGLSTYVDVSDTIVEGSFTLALWLKYDTLRQGGYNAVMHTDGWTSGSVHVHMRTGTRLFNFDVNGGIGATTDTVLNAGEWYHLAGSLDTSERVAKVYVDGLLDGTNTSGGAATPSIGLLNIGAWNDNDRFFDGVMDDFRIYDRALSAAEMAWLAGRTSSFSIPADLHEDDVIDFKDLAVLGDSWLEEILWP